MSINNTKISNEKRVKLLGVNLEGRINFDHYVNTHLKTLSRVCNHMDRKRGRILLNAFITSHFSYCAFVWMFYSRTLNYRINKIHEKTLRLAYKDLKHFCILMTY